MPRTAALGVVDQETRIALLSLQKRLTVLEKGAFDGRKNLLDNGEMKVSQRYPTSTGYAPTAATGIFTDRWNLVPVIGTSVIYPSYPTLSDEYGTFAIYDSGATPHTMAAGEYSYIRQGIEGINLQHLKWGTPAAKPLTFSIYALCTTAQNIIIELEVVGGSAISRTIALTPTFTRYSVTFPGLTTTAIPFVTTIALGVNIWVASGSTYAGGASLNTSWATPPTNNMRAFGVGNLFASAARQFWFTGCQLEVGTAATPFEHRSYAAELDACMRYFWQSPIGANYPIMGPGEITAATTGVVSVRYGKQMRAIPALTTVGNLRLIDQFGASGYAVTTLALTAANQSTTETAYLDATCSGGGMTGGRFVHLQGNNDTTCTVRFSAEI